MTELFTRQQIEAATRRLREENAGIRPKKAEVIQYLTLKHYGAPKKDKKSVSSGSKSISSLSSTSSDSTSSSSSSDTSDWDDDEGWGIKWPNPPKLQKEDVGPSGAEVARRVDEFESTRGQVISEKGGGLRDFSQPPQPELSQKKRLLTEADLEPLTPPGTPPGSPREKVSSVGYSQENSLFRRGTPSDRRAYAELKKVEEEQKKKEAEKAEKTRLQRERDELGRKGEGYAYPGRTYVRSKELTKARVALDARAAAARQRQVAAEAERVRREAEEVARNAEEAKKGLKTAEVWEVARRKKTERDHRQRGL
jgi:hypothetical protein